MAKVERAERLTKHRVQTFRHHVPRILIGRGWNIVLKTDGILGMQTLTVVCFSLPQILRDIRQGLMQMTKEGRPGKHSSTCVSSKRGLVVKKLFLYAVSSGWKGRMFLNISVWQAR